ncbi:cation-translocating P-type ATPase [Aminithiophilus ramosus]|uniref:Cation-translocating P-type ATPase n=2 Tax=Synergistales TaxID=649776 RepID=A0A9Q7A502_9BACT|nr:cation-translocating P-type ATPase [Aminithiophilus ramosus]QTX31366.1 cation-translocating P-type ATPase [Aminithiophilus ramosus]QVL35165.1 cation-translocating P-type ATPase [Synergistota bacterium]
MGEPHVLSVEEVLHDHDTLPERGLSSAEAERRLGEYGPNELVERGGKKAWQIVLAQVRDVMILILLAAVLVSLALGEYGDGVVIFVIVVLNTALGFWQEFKAEKAMAALKQMAVPLVRVRRDGAERQISAKGLVPGDILLLEAGNVVPADGRLIAVANLKVQEAALTGESEAVEKETGRLEGDAVPLGDRRNMVYTGTVVTYGRGEAVVTATAMATELGAIASMLQDLDDGQTPLQRRLARLGRSLAMAAVALIFVVAAMMYGQGVSVRETFMTAISMAVAAIPEGLPAVVTISLALGAQQMLRKKALIRRLHAVETLGGVTVICSDKTGTLTKNRMTVTEMVLPRRRYVWDRAVTVGQDDDLGLLLLTGALCNDAVVGAEEGAVLGDPTEGALVLAALKAGLDPGELKSRMPRVGELPFDSERKRMSTVHALSSVGPGGIVGRVLSLAGGRGRHVVLTKGAVDGLIEVCSGLLLNGAVEPLTEAEKKGIAAENVAMAEKGLRVLGMACRFLEGDELDRPGSYERDLVFLGMAAMIDPVRPEAVEAVGLCRQAGIRPVMITGDHPLTALAIARELGLSATGVLTGADLDGMSPEELKERIRDVSVFARVSPRNKMTLVEVLQGQGEIVAMTGDGVNDAPALKAADIGVAMGITGTDVTKESSDMILLDDNFATIVASVKEGRRIYDNIRKFVRYILTGNTGEIVVMLVGPLLGMALPLLPIQILWINLMTDGLPAVALSYEKAERGVMSRRPQDPQEGVFARGLGWQILLMGFVIGGVSLGVGYRCWSEEAASKVWQTMIFTTLTFCQMAYALCVREEERSLFSPSFASNPVLLLAVAVTLGLQLSLVYVPFLNALFRTAPLGAGELGLCVAGAMTVVALSEGRKLLSRRRNLR